MWSTGKVWICLGVVGCLCILAAEARAQNRTDDDTTDRVMTVPLPPQYNPSLNFGLAKHHARYQLLHGKYESFAEYLYHFYRRRATVGRRRLIIGTVIAGVSAAVFSGGLMMTFSEDDSTADAGYELMVVSLYGGLTAAPFLIAGGIKYGKNKRHMEQLGPFVSPHRWKPVALKGIGVMPSKNGFGVGATVAF